MPFDFQRIEAIPDLVIVTPRVLGDPRGWFMEAYKSSEFASFGISESFHQDSHSRSTHGGTLRGLHYQIQPAAQGKLVRCVAGAVFDVAVDIRRPSPTFGRWSSTTLSAENQQMLWIPPGFAHGFCSLEDGSEVVYKTTAEYSAECERSIRWDDPTIDIKWPMADPILSEKDQAAPLFEQATVFASCEF